MKTPTARTSTTDKSLLDALADHHPDLHDDVVNVITFQIVKP